jgi:alanyl-tRNA synthetase
MTVSEVRQKFLDFYAKRGHVVVPSSSLVPENDATTLFTGSGMQPLVPYLLGQTHPAGKRIVDSQKSFRAEDIEEVGDNRHTTFFEMLGNWSFGDYFKKEQLSWFFEFLTSKEEGLGLDPQKIHVTVFSGGQDIPRDDESIAIWTELFASKGITAKYGNMVDEAHAAGRGMHDDERIFGYEKKNWWSRAGGPEKMPAGEPGGPDSEMFYDFGTPHDERFGKYCHPNCDCGRFLEIGNSVFMEFRKKENGGFENLPQRNVDFGGGLERQTAAANGDPDVFRVDVFRAIIEELEKRTEFRYDAKGDHADETVKAFRIVADHLRASIFMLADKVVPSNTERGYVLRRLLRRAIRYADFLQIGEGLDSVVPVLSVFYKTIYPEILGSEALIRERIREEEAKFRKTLVLGHRELLGLVSGKNMKDEHIERISGSDLFFIYSTYGYPLELSYEEIEGNILPELQKDERVLAASGFYDKTKITEEFREEFKKHQDLSRTATAGVFKGGLADHSEKVVRLHTATHLMNAALRKVLGDHVWQKGSNITNERTRFDFTHPEKLTDAQKEEVEHLVNQWIEADYEMKKDILPREEAEKLGAIGVFGEKYPDTVSVYTVWNPTTGEVVSREFCGGPHVDRTGSIGKFRILKEEASSAGIRRLKATID